MSAEQPGQAEGEWRLGIVGASARSAAMSARRAGLLPVTADLFGDRDLRRMAAWTPLHSLTADLAGWDGWGEVACWIYTGGLENHPTLVDRLSRRCHLAGNGAASLRGCRDPLQLQEVLSRAGVRFPRTLPAGPVPTAPGRWLRKTYRGAGGNGTSWLDPAQVSAADKAYRQQYVEGVPLAALYVAEDSGARLLGVTRQWVGEPLAHAAPFQYCGSLTCDSCDEYVQAKIERAGRVVADAFRLRGLFGIDLVLAADEPYVIEVNPRYTAAAEVLEIASGIATLSHHLVACGLMAAAPIGQQRVEQAAGKLIHYAGEPLEMTNRMTAWAEARSNWWNSIAVADISQPGTRIAAGAPIWTLLARAATAGEVESLLRSLVDESERVIYGQEGTPCE